jgi:putative spermidine/putrescine transport system substrate-binding protein
MMKRRSFLVGGSTLALSQLVSGCNRQQQASLDVQLLKGSIPPQMLNEFRKGLKPPVQLNFDPEEQLNNLFERLKTWKEQAENKNSQQRWSIPFIHKKTPPLADLVTLGDYWLASAIEQGLIQPIQVEDLEGWQKLPPRWQEIVTRNRQGQLVAKDGQVWGAPYRWGTTVIAYRRDKFQELGWTPKDWSDLWRPELQGHISLLDQPREVIGLTLKKLGKSYNTEKLSEVPSLKEELLKLHQQVKYYSSNKYLEPLILGDTWLALGWSTDVLSVRSSYSQIEAIMPLSGTAIWADVWVQPASVSNNSNSVNTSASPTPAADAKASASLTKRWIEFCWQPQSAKEISILSHATSPLFVGVDSKTLPKDLQENRLLLPDSSVLDNSEFLKPLSKEALKEYEQLWTQIRNVRHS